jgi:predicted secreted protein
MQIKRKIFLLTLTLSITLSTHAGDASQWEIIGFSKDGNYFAFERFGSYDGSGFPYSEIFILNVCKNDYATKPITTVVEEENTNVDARTVNRKKAKSLLTQFGIIIGNVGQTFYERKQEDEEVPPFTYRNQKMQVLLETEDLALNDQIGVNLQKMTLSLKHPKGIQVLQKDKSLPKSRGSAYSYWIATVVAYENSLIALVSYYSVGYEGPDTRQIAVSGCLPK